MDKNKNGASFARLTKHFVERQSCEKAVPDLIYEMTFNHLPYSVRIALWANRIKYRFLFVACLGLGFAMWGNMLGFVCAKIERVFKKHKKRWIFRNNLKEMTYETALETLYEPTKLSRPSTEKLSQLFI